MNPNQTHRRIAERRIIECLHTLEESESCLALVEETEGTEFEQVGRVSPLRAVCHCPAAARTE